jgi:hypothetical protein
MSKFWGTKGSDSEDDDSDEKDKSDEGSDFFFFSFINKNGIHCALCRCVWSLCLC